MTESATGNSTEKKLYFFAREKRGTELLFLPLLFPFLRLLWLIVFSIYGNLAISEYIKCTMSIPDIGWESKVRRTKSNRTFLLGKCLMMHIANRFSKTSIKLCASTNRSQHLIFPEKENKSHVWWKKKGINVRNCQRISNNKTKNENKKRKKNKLSDLHDSIYLLAMQLTGN